jgi:alkanesulfonate monooxygenase SsuD/methylene tetrahydromethanopterin reductase-like flavin-dependent oxidoreductase (luciferase family)
VSVPDDIKFYFFHHHHYSDIPPDEDRFTSTMVDYPNSIYDPERGHALYQRHLRIVRLAEELGFDGIAINEHHNMVYSMTPTVSVMAGAIVNATSRAKIQVAGVPINLEYPNRVAEEYAMLDVMSGGRMEFAFPLGTGMEYWANAGAINPATARARFRESLDVIMQAWTQDGPTRYEGDFYTYRFLNPFVRPYQKPRPKCFIVGTGSKETVQLAVDYDLGYSIVFVPIANQLRAFNQFRELAAERGREVSPDDLTIVVMAYVADTDEEAVKEARPHIEKFFSWFHRVPPKYLVPPGYVTTEEFLRRVSDVAMAEGKKATWDDMVAIGRIACGSPATVADIIGQWCEEAACSRVNVVCELGDMPEWKTVKSMTKFTGEVIPKLRAGGVAVAAADGRPAAAAGVS